MLRPVRVTPCYNYWAAGGTWKKILSMWLVLCWLLLLCVAVRWTNMNMLCDELIVSLASCLYQLCSSYKCYVDVRVVYCRSWLFVHVRVTVSADDVPATESLSLRTSWLIPASVISCAMATSRWGSCTCGQRCRSTIENAFWERITD